MNPPVAVFASKAVKGRDNRMAVFADADAVVRTLRPDVPVTCIYPEKLRENAERFLSVFPGQVLYAVKSNPDPRVMRYLYGAGIRHFDVASAEEVTTTRSLFPKARLSFMHPVKSRSAIATAYRLGVRDYALDSASELLKIVEETGSARDLNLFVRVALPKGNAAYDLSGKFGAHEEDAVTLLQAARRVAARVGLCFHVGSQCMEPAAYATAIERVRALVDRAGVVVDILDVGGGFPVSYPGLEPPAFGLYMDAIQNAAQHLFPAIELWCEPGRALAGSGGSVIVKVELRRGHTLYINDGTYGSLFDAGSFGWRYPVRAIRPDSALAGALEPFSFFGPTCDTVDYMKGPFMLPADIAEGDWIEIGQLGAYGAAMRTRFNGFYSDETVAIVPSRAYDDTRTGGDAISITDHLPARQIARSGRK